MMKPSKVGLKSKDLEGRLMMTRKDTNDFHSATRRVLLCARIFGLLPMSGLTNPNSQGLRFNLLSPYSVIYVISLCGQGLVFIMNLYWLVENKISLPNVTNFIFYTSSLLSTLILACIGRCWPKLMKEVETIENHLPSFTRKVPSLCNVTMIFILSLSLIEHLLSILYGYTVARTCHSSNIAETFFRYQQPWFFSYTTYSTWKGVFVEIFNIQATFIWSYNDVLIMVISIYLAEHFKVHNKLLKNALKWEHFSCDEFRIQYVKIVRLVRLLNGHVGIYILTSFGSNLYWICTQLFYCLNKNHTGHFISCPSRTKDSVDAVLGLEHTIYFTFSFSYLVARAFLVLILAARVHSTSIAPLPLLYEIPSSRFSNEIDRYIAQVSNIKVALTGMGFFYVTRTMIFTLLAKIVTYELVLFQFNT